MAPRIIRFSRQSFVQALVKAATHHKPRYIIKGPLGYVVYPYPPEQTPFVCVDGEYVDIGVGKSPASGSQSRRRV